MDDEDFRSLLALTQRELLAVGGGDISDQSHYMFPSEDGEYRLMEPSARLIHMLQALDRKMSLQSRETFDKAMTNLHEAIDGEPPQFALVELPREEGWKDDKVNLGNAPDLGDVRRNLSQLIGQLLESRPLGRSRP